MTKTRGVFEHQPGVWWIQYFADGRRRREKVGRKSDAIKLYQIRKAEAHAGVKLPGSRSQRGTRFGELIADVLAFTADHKSAKTYHIRAGIVGRDWEKRAA